MELGDLRAVGPLVEETLQTHAAGFFEALTELEGFDLGELVGADVIGQGAEEGFVAELAAEHVKEERALGVGVGGAIEDIVGTAVFLAGHGGLVGGGAGVGGDDGLLPFPDLGEVGVGVGREPGDAAAGGGKGGIAILEPEPLEVGGEALVEPDVLPGFAGERGRRTTGG